MDEELEVGLVMPDDDSGIEILGVDTQTEDAAEMGVEGLSLSGEDVFMVDLGEGDLMGGDLDVLAPDADGSADIL